MSKTDLTRRELEDRAKQAYWTEFQASIIDLFQVAPSRWGGPDALHYRAEKLMIKRHVEPIYWGGIVAVFLFATFRVSGSKWYERFRARVTAKHSPTSSAGAAPPKPVQPPKQWMSHLDKRQEKSHEYTIETLRLPTDIFVSLLCGMSSIALLSKPNEIEQDFIEAPLLPGKSVIYERVCPNMEEAFNMTYDRRILEGEIDLGVRTFAAMVHNCKTRTAFLSAQQQGEMRGIVPYPGLKGSRREFM